MPEDPDLDLQTNVQPDPMADMRLALGEDGDYEISSKSEPPPIEEIDDPTLPLTPKVDLNAQSQTELAVARQQLAEAQRVNEQWRQWHQSNQYSMQQQSAQQPDPAMADFFQAAGGQDKLAAWVHQEASRISDARYAPVLQQQQAAISGLYQKILKSEMEQTAAKYPDLVGIFSAKLPEVQALMAAGRSIEEIYRTLNPTGAAQSVRTQKKSRTVNAADQDALRQKSLKLATERGSAAPEEQAPKIKSVEDAINLSLRQMQTKRRAG